MAEILCKVGHKVPETHKDFELNWKDGQIIDIRPDEYYIQSDSINGETTCKSFCVIQLPDIDYWGILGASNYRDLKYKVSQSSIIRATWQDINKYTTPKIGGKLPWEMSTFTREGTRRKRDWFIDFRWLYEQGLITIQQYRSIYDKTANHYPIVIRNKTLSSIIKNEDTDHRLPVEKMVYGTIDAAGTYTVGTAQTYATWVAAEADLPANFDAMGTPGNIIFSGNTDEELSQGGMTWHQGTGAYTLTLTAADSVKHNGGAYGNGHRINWNSDYDSWDINDSYANNLKITIQKLAFDISGVVNYGVYGSICKQLIVERCVIKGDADSSSGIYVCYNDETAVIRNNIIYGCSGTNGKGIQFQNEWGYTFIFIANNTCFSNRYGISTNFDSAGDGGGTLNVGNNVCGDNSSGDYYQILPCADINSINVSKDGSGSTSYTGWTNTACFTDYANKDFRLRLADPTLDDATDLSAIGAPAQFSNDIQGTTRITWYSGASEYPLTFGNTGITATDYESTGSDRGTVGKLTVTISGTGTISSITFRTAADSGSINAKAIIYADSSGSPGARLAVGSVVSVSTIAQYISTLSYVFSSGTYHIGLVVDGSGRLRCDIETGTANWKDSLGYSSPADPFGTPTGTDTNTNCEVYATYTLNGIPGAYLMKFGDTLNINV
jgi:hypothetical protein